MRSRCPQRTECVRWRPSPPRWTCRKVARSSPSSRPRIPRSAWAGCTKPTGAFSPRARRRLPCFGPSGRRSRSWESKRSSPFARRRTRSKGEALKDLSIELEHRPGALAEMGEALGRAGVSVEGGGAFLVNGVGVAHFLFADGDAAQRALEEAGIRVLAQREVLVQRLNQDEPGQLGKIARRMAEAGVNIEVIYSDHGNQLILVVDDVVRGREVSKAWMRERGR